MMYADDYFIHELVFPKSLIIISGISVVVFALHRAKILLTSEVKESLLFLPCTQSHKFYVVSGKEV